VAGERVPTEQQEHAEHDHGPIDQRQQHRQDRAERPAQQVERQPDAVHQGQHAGQDQHAEQG